MLLSPKFQGSQNKKSAVVVSSITSLELLRNDYSYFLFVHSYSNAILYFLGESCHQKEPLMKARDFGAGKMIQVCSGICGRSIPEPFAVKPWITRKHPTHHPERSLISAETAEMASAGLRLSHTVKQKKAISILVVKQEVTFLMPFQLL